MRAAIIVATRGRSQEVARLLDYLARQSVPAHQIIVVGAEPADVAGLTEHVVVQSGCCQIVIARKPGLPIQRNAGIQYLLDSGFFGSTAGEAFVTFFDDDFRPADDWLERAGFVFSQQNDVAGLTGRVLADGVKTAALSEADAAGYLSGVRPPQRHWAGGAMVVDVASLYGCNMAFRDVVVREHRFDEELPLYAWQEDRDFTSQAKAHGRTIYEPSCRGVHLGTKAARSSGLRMGYSQIANPLYLAGKGTMKREHAARFIARALAANCLKSMRRHPLFDYRGRLAGNLQAIADLCVGRCHPGRILQL